MPSHAFHQLRVQFPDQADRKGEFPETEDTVFQSHHVITDLTEILRASFDGRACLGRQQLTEGGLCAFNLAGQNSLTPHKRPH